MFLIEGISTKIGHNLASYLNMDKDHEEILTYGAFSLLHTLLSILLVMVFGLVFHVFFEALIISFTGSILRKYSGGVHSTSPNRCAIIGTTISVSCSIAVVFISKTIPFTYIILLITIGLIYSYYYIYKYAPVDSSSKPIHNILKRQRLKKYSIIILSIMCGTISILVILYKSFGSNIFFIYSSCIAIGIVWQTFTLTHLGHKLLHKIDCIFSKI